MGKRIREIRSLGKQDISSLNCPTGGYIVATREDGSFTRWNQHRVKEFRPSFFGQYCERYREVENMNSPISQKTESSLERDIGRSIDEENPVKTESKIIIAGKNAYVVDKENREYAIYPIFKNYKNSRYSNAPDIIKRRILKKAGLKVEDLITIQANYESLVCLFRGGRILTLFRPPLYRGRNIHQEQHENVVPIENFVLFDLNHSRIISKVRQNSRAISQFPTDIKVSHDYSSIVRESRSRDNDILIVYPTLNGSVIFSLKDLLREDEGESTRNITAHKLLGYNSSGIYIQREKGDGFLTTFEDGYIPQPKKVTPSGSTVSGSRHIIHYDREVKIRLPKNTSIKNATIYNKGTVVSESGRLFSLDVRLPIGSMKRKLEVDVYEVPTQEPILDATANNVGEIFFTSLSGELYIIQKYTPGRIWK